LKGLGHTGEWRAFFDLRSNWRLARRHPTLLLPVMIAFVVTSAAILLLRMIPYFAGSDPALGNLSVEQLRQWLNRYHLAAGAILLPAYVWVWSAIGKAYARAMALEFRYHPAETRLYPLKREALARLQLPSEPSQRTNPFLRGTSWTFGRLATAGALALNFLLWFAVAAEVLVSQFFNYLPGVNWLNHPLVLLPWIKYVPPTLVP